MKRIFTLLAVCFATVSFAQLNPMLENWTPMVNAMAVSFDSPDDWEGSTSYYTLVANAPVTIFKETANPGESVSSAKIITELWPGSPLGNDTLAGALIQRIPFTAKPPALDFKVNANPQPTDANIVFVLLTHWDGTQTVTDGYGMKDYTASSGGWINDQISMTYFTADTPDSLQIICVSSPGQIFESFNLGTSQIGSELMVDSFVFDMSIPCPTADVANYNDDECGEGYGWAWANATGGVMPYSYVWDNGQTDQALTGLSAGTYGFTVTDAGGCSDMGSFNIISNPPLDISLTSTPATCGASDGTASILSESGGTTPYTYNWSNGESTGTINNLAAGAYLMTITDANGCRNGDGVAVNNIGAPAVSVTEQNISCFGMNNGVVSAITVGGTGTLTYEWIEYGSGNIVGTDQTLTGMPAGLYIVSVTDANGCLSVDGAEIEEPAMLDGGIISVTPATCGNSDGAVYAGASGGTTPYSYLWDNGSTSASQTNMAAAVVYLTLTDANGCVEIDINAIYNNGGAWVSVTDTDLSCYGANDGSITATVSGGATPYSMEWSDLNTGTSYGSGLALTGLGQGLYVITVTDAAGCVSYSGSDVSEPAPISLSTQTTNESSVLAWDATAMAITSGGTPPYFWSWDNSSVGDSLWGMTAGIYVVTVTDDNGCTESATAYIVVDGSCDVSVTTSSTDGTCTEGAYASATASGGTSPYNYSWENGEVGQYATMLWTGEHSVTVTDAIGCTAVAEITVTNMEMMDFQLTTTEPSCGSTDGTVSVINESGQTPFTYTWSNGMTDQVLTGMGPGAYLVTVTDAQGCTRWSGTGLANIGAATITMGSTDVTCFGGADGTMNVTATGGTTPYTYAWSNLDDMATVIGTDESISGLTSQVYIVTVTDANGCISIDGYGLSEAGVINVSVSTTSASTDSSSDGDATVSATGGSGSGYTYAWSNGLTTATITGLVTGSYGVTVQDSNGCTGEAVAAVNYQGGCLINVDIINVQHVNMAGASNGSAEASVSGGTGNFTYLWSGGINPASNIANGLSAGTWTCTVTDELGCTAVGSVVITEPGATIVVDYDEVNGLEIFPNPTQGAFNLVITSEIETNYNVRLMNMVGQLIYNDQVVVKGETTQFVNVKDIDTGVYFLTIENKFESITKKLIIK